MTKFTDPSKKSKYHKWDEGQFKLFVSNLNQLLIKYGEPEGDFTENQKDKLTL